MWSERLPHTSASQSRFRGTGTSTNRSCFHLGTVTVYKSIYTKYKLTHPSATSATSAAVKYSRTEALQACLKDWREWTYVGFVKVFVGRG